MVENSVHSPNDQSDPMADRASHPANRLRRASQIIALLVAALGLLVFCGWAFNVPTLTYIRPTFQSMKVNTALSFLCLGAGLALAHDDKRRRRRFILGLLVVLIAAATLTEYALHVNFGIDQLLFRDTRTPLSGYPGRMAIATAICFLLLGLALTLLGIKKAIALQRALVGTCFALSLAALCGYLYGVESLYSITSFSTVAVHTAAGLIAACLAYFLACPDEGIMSIAATDSNSGFLLRTLLPAIIGVPILIGWLRLEGQRAHLYDTPIGVGLQVLGSIGCLTALTLLIVRSMHRLECAQSRGEQAVRESEIWHRRIIETTNEGVWLLDAKLYTSYVNRQMAEMLGYEPHEMVGRSVFDFYFPADVAQKKQTLSRRQQGLQEQLDERLRRRDGSELWVRMAATPVLKDNAEFEGALAMVSDITERKRAEEALRQSEERFRLAAQAGKMYAYEWDVETDLLIRSSEYAKILGGTEPKLFTRQQFLSKIHPDDHPKFMAAIAGLSPANPVGDVTYRVLLPSGTVWLKNSGRAFFDGQGRMLRVIGMVADVTDQKLAEEALSHMAGKLIEAQEQERTRIARELHDDINQRLAMLAIELEQVRENRPDLPPDVLRRMQELRQQTSQISADLQALSHDLHCAQLEYLGVVAGIKSWCTEFGERQRMEIDCRHDVGGVLPAEIGLCLFRVLQEALHNAAKHSGVKRIEVQLREESDEIHLIVCDCGRGFDVEKVKQGKGLGLTSMRERVRLVNGTITIESRPMGGGTTIHVRVPLDSERGFQRQAV